MVKSLKEMNTAELANLDCDYREHMVAPQKSPRKGMFVK
jgi:hypothetical protein